MSERIPIGCRPIDEMLKGGIECGILTQIFGESGSGKTNMCLQFSRSVLETDERKHVLYIDTEGVSGERLAQVFKGQEENLDRILFFRPESMQEQARIIRKEVGSLLKGGLDVGAIICDTLTMYYRTHLNTELEIEAKRILGQEINALLRYAHSADVPVMATNQVYTNIERSTLEPIGGNLLAHSSKIIIELVRLTGPFRLARLVKHRSIRDGGEARFRIADEGLIDPEEYRGGEGNGG